MTAEPGKWQNVSAGPRQVKDLRRAIGALLGEGRTRDEMTGVIGGEERVYSPMSPMDPPRPEVAALDEAIREKYGHTVTRENVRAIIADYEAALPEARKSRPVDDNRRTPEEDAEIRARAAGQAAAYQAERDAGAALLAQVIAKAPSGARALIFAEYHQDTSDTQTDYFSSRVTRTAAIGFRTSSREDFRALRAAAGQFPETAHMASEEALAAWLGSSPATLEYRDNYSGGGGNYLSDHGSASYGSGWVVKSREFPCSYVHLTEDAVPASRPAAELPAGPGTVTLSPSSIGRDGVVEIRFSEKPSEETRDALTAHGFRWARGNRCWYGTDIAYAQALATAAGSPGESAAEAGAPAGAAALQEDRHLTRDY
jgi:hypothetical protein